MNDANDELLTPRQSLYAPQQSLYAPRQSLYAPPLTRVFTFMFGNDFSALIDSYLILHLNNPTFYRAPLHNLKAHDKTQALFCHRKHGIIRHLRIDKNAVCQETFKRNERHGTFKLWYTNGKIQHIYRMKHGKLHGRFTSWYENYPHRKHFEHMYKDGVLEGETKIYYKNGKLKRTASYCGGYLRSKQYYKKHPHVYPMYSFHNGKVHVADNMLRHPQKSQVLHDIVTENAVSYISQLFDQI